MNTKLTRRSFLITAGSAAALPALPLFSQGSSPASPDEALRRLMDGNGRFAKDEITSIAQDLKLLKEHTVDKQEPFAAVLSCADSRVPVELVFDQTIGHIFVTRVAGNIINAEIVGSLEYGAAVLGVQVVMVMGHSNCGAVKAAMAKKPVPGQIASLYPHLEPAVAASGGDAVAAIKKNAQIQADLLANTSTVLRPLIAEGKLKICSAFYDVGTGVVTLL